MNIFQRLVPAWVLVCLVCPLALAAGRLIADDGDPLATTVRTAWRRFSDLQTTKTDYGERAEVALTMIQAERERADVDAAVRDLKIQIDGFPPRRTNLQQEVYDQWLACRQRLSELDLFLAQLKSRWQELNEIAIRQAEVNGKRVRPLDRVGLLHKLQELDRECFDRVRLAPLRCDGRREHTKPEPGGGSQECHQQRNAIQRFGRRTCPTARIRQCVPAVLRQRIRGENKEVFSYELGRVDRIDNPHDTTSIDNVAVELSRRCPPVKRRESSKVKR